VNRGPQKGTLVYYVFDPLTLDGKDLRGSCHWRQGRHGQSPVLKNHPRLLYIDHLERNGLAMCAGAMGGRRRGCEGC
jgi:hypothetical protein